MGTLQVGGTTLGVKNSGTGKVDLSNVGTVTLGSSTVFPNSVRDRTDWYTTIIPGSTTSQYNGHLSTPSTSDTGYFIASGVAPQGMVSVQGMNWHFCTENSTNDDYKLSWLISAGGDGSGTTYNEHSMGETAMGFSLTPATNTLFSPSIMGAGSTNFEGTISAGDTFSLRIDIDSATTTYSMGISITWRF